MWQFFETVYEETNSWMMTTDNPGRKVILQQICVTPPGLIGSPKLGNVWVFVQLIFGPGWPMNQLNKNPNIA